MEVDLTPLENRLAYTFSDRRRLYEALCHTSYANECPNGKQVEDNQRLEFLGDAVLNLVVGHLLWERFPHLREGDLSKMRSGLVNEPRLAECARALDLGTFLRIGKGEEQNNGREKPSILADTFEAVIAAVYLDGGFPAAFRLIESRFLPFLEAPGLLRAATDAKSRLQEIVQHQRQRMPVYTVLQEEGPDHDKTFRVRVEVLGITAEGMGKSKKSAERHAAQNALARIHSRTAPAFNE
ncbi:MAG: ribonuclease III [Deltaproteobacteria bacterium]|nr:ribonuclease III [Deltaproteobacteria bacterium]